MEQSLISSETEVVDCCPKKSKQNLYLTEKCAFLNHVKFCLTCLSHISHISYITWKLLDDGYYYFHITGEFRMQLTFTLLFTVPGHPEDCMSCC